MVLQREPSWPSLRDHLLFGDLVAAHALAPLPLAATLGIASPRVPVLTALTLSLNGNAITVSTALHQRLTDAGLTGGDQPLLAGLALRQVIHAKPATKLHFAVVSPVSNHHWPAGADAAALIPRVYRCAEYRQAAHALQIPVPKEDFVAWGGEAQPWLLADDLGGTIRMGANRIFDGSSVLP